MLPEKERLAPGEPGLKVLLRPGRAAKQAHQGKKPGEPSDTRSTFHTDNKYNIKRGAVNTSAFSAGAARLDTRQARR